MTSNTPHPKRFQTLTAEQLKPVQGGHANIDPMAFMTDPIWL